MIKVREASKTTISLIVLFICISLLIYYSRTQPQTVFYQVEMTVSSKLQISGFYGFLLSVSFWVIFLSSVIEAIFRDKCGVKILEPFARCIVFSVCMTVVGIVVIYVSPDITWFWEIYYVGIIISVILSYNKLSKITGSGASNIKIFIKTLPSSNDESVNLVDRRTLYVSKMILLIDLFCLLISFIVFWIQNRYIWGL